MDKHENSPAINSKSARLSKSAANEQSAAVLAFLHSFSLSDVPDKVVIHARYLMLDLLGLRRQAGKLKTLILFAIMQLALWGRVKNNLPCRFYLMGGR